MQLPQFQFVLVPILSLIAASGCQRVSTPLPAVVATAVSATSLPSSTEDSANTDSRHQFIGRVSCSATACHGHNSVTPVSWNNAYQVWDLSDPHRRAFEVLYSELSVEIYLRMEQIEKKDLDDAKYLHFLEQKCVGCHATPPPGSIVGAKLAEQPKPDAYWQGVSCESCHGAAGDWYGRHYSQTWQSATGTERASFQAHDFSDLRPLASRSAVCLKCHVGPQTIGTLSYDVNHDLIAAGHPRLNFEFNAYLTNLPKHWDEAADRKQQGAAAASFHFEAWRVGQIQQLQQIDALQSTRPQEPWAEFASHDCRDCHHALGEPQYDLTQNKRPGLKELNRLATLTDDSQRAAFLLDWLDQNKSPADARLRLRFDTAVDIYLANTALAQDLKPPVLDQAVAELRLALQAQAGHDQYHLPAKFDSQRAKAAFDLLEKVLDGVKRSSPIK